MPTEHDETRRHDDFEEKKKKHSNGNGEPMMRLQSSHWSFGKAPPEKKHEALSEPRTTDTMTKTCSTLLGQGAMRGGLSLTDLPLSFRVVDRLEVVSLSEPMERCIRTIIFSLFVRVISSTDWCWSIHSSNSRHCSSDSLCTLSHWWAD